jgi:hypothetical protein
LDDSIDVSAIVITDGEPLPDSDCITLFQQDIQGVLETKAANIYKKPYLITEHGNLQDNVKEEILRTDGFAHIKNYGLLSFTCSPAGL